MLDPLPERPDPLPRPASSLSTPPTIASGVRHAFAIPRRPDLPAPFRLAPRPLTAKGLIDPRSETGRYCPTCRHDLRGARERWCLECGTPVDPDDESTFDAYPRPLISGATVLLTSTLTGWVTTIIALRDAIFALDLEVIVREGLIGGAGLGLLLLIPFFCVATVVNEAYQACRACRSGRLSVARG